MRRRRAVLELGLLVLAVVWVVGPAHLLPGARALGQPTRDLFDHLALLDAWLLHTTAWSWPDGGVLVPPDPTGMLMASPFLWFGRAAAYNWAVTLQLCLAAAAAWALGRRHGGGLVAGLAYGLSPYLVGQAISGEAETLAAWPLPVVALLLEVGGRRAWIGAGLVAAVGALASWYHGAFLAFYVVAWVGLRELPARRWGALWTPGVFAVAVAGPAALYAWVLASPEQLFRGPTMQTYLAEQPRALAGMSADPAGWLGLDPPGAAHVDLLGGVILLLAVVGALRWRGRGWWLGVVLTALALSLGPLLHLRGVTVGASWPYRALMWVPGFDLMRLPHRWTLVATLGLAVLAARGARLVPRLGPALVFVELLWFGVPVRPDVDVRPPAIHQGLTGPVLDLPPRTLGGDARGRYLVWQRAHGRPVPYSLLMQSWSAAVSEEPLVVAVAAMDRRDEIAVRVREAAQFRQADFATRVAEWRFRHAQPALLEGAAARLRARGFAQVVLHRQLLNPEDADDIEMMLVELLGRPELATSGGRRWRL